MKKGIEVWHEWTRIGKNSRSVLAIHVKKAKGKLTLDEIKAAVKEACGEDFYLLTIDLYHEESEPQYDEDTSGDFVTLYLAYEMMHLAAEDYD